MSPTTGEALWREACYRTGDARALVVDVALEACL